MVIITYLLRPCLYRLCRIPALHDPLSYFSFFFITKFSFSLTPSVRGINFFFSSTDDNLNCLVLFILSPVMPES